MPPLEDDSINGSTVIIDKSSKVNIIKPKMTLRDRMIDYVINNEKPTKGDIFSNVSSSGTAQVILTSLITTGVYIQHKFECGSCVWYEVDKTKVHEV